MAHNITKLDIGFVTGGATWHGRPEYRVVENIGIDDVLKCVDYPVEKLPTYLGTEFGGEATGGHCIARMDTPRPTVLAPNIGDRYAVLDRKALVNQFDECLLAVFPQLKIAGCGTLSSGRTFWMQFLAERYGIKGDKSDHELRLCYSETYGWTAHEVYCSHVRIVCDNTLRMAKSEAVAAGLFQKLRHTAGAAVKINATAEEFAELHLQLERDRAMMEYLAGEPATDATVKEFLAEMLPEPKPAPGEKEPSTKAMNRWKESVSAVWDKWNIGPESMESETAHSRYGILQSWTDYVDHDSYSRSPYDRWMDAQNGQRAASKQRAVEWLLQTV